MEEKGLAKCKGEAGSRKKRGAMREPMDKNRIRGRPGRTSGQTTAKFVSIKGTGCKSGGCARTVAELTSGDLPFCCEFAIEGSDSS